MLEKDIHTINLEMHLYLQSHLIADTMKPVVFGKRLCLILQMERIIGMKNTILGRINNRIKWGKPVRGLIEGAGTAWQDSVKHQTLQLGR